MPKRTCRKDTMKVVFVLPADAPAGPVSVVGDFNGWDPAAHPPTEPEDGMRAATVPLPATDWALSARVHASALVRALAKAAVRGSRQAPLHTARAASRRRTGAAAGGQLERDAGFGQWPTDVSGGPGRH